jgi:hypothetical protein
LRNTFHMYEEELLVGRLSGAEYQQQRYYSSNHQNRPGGRRHGSGKYQHNSSDDYGCKKKERQRDQ